MSEMRHSKTVLTEPEIRVYVSDWKGKPQLHARKFIETETYKGPTKQGVAIPLDNVLELVDGILAVYKEETGQEFAVCEVKELDVKIDE